MFREEDAAALDAGNETLKDVGRRLHERLVSLVRDALLAEAERSAPGQPVHEGLWTVETLMDGGPAQVVEGRLVDWLEDTGRDMVVAAVREFSPNWRGMERQTAAQTAALVSVEDACAALVPEDAVLGVGGGPKPG